MALIPEWKRFLRTLSRLASGRETTFDADRNLVDPLAIKLITQRLAGLMALSQRLKTA